MQDITLQALLEAGCHFGHKAERWHPKASEFIYARKDGIHIIDLTKTKIGLEAAVAFVKEVLARGDEVLFVATKRQARGVVKEEVEKVGAPYFVERWIGGFLTNWDSIKKNIEKIHKLTTDEASGGWKKFPKHEQVQLARYVAKLKMFYGGVLKLTAVPGVLVIVDIKKEIAAVRECQRRGIPIIAIVDTNADPTGIDHVIPANDDAVGSIQFIVHVLAEAYNEGKMVREKAEKIVMTKETKVEVATDVKTEGADVATKKTEPKKTNPTRTPSLPVGKASPRVVDGPSGVNEQANGSKKVS